MQAIVTRKPVDTLRNLPEPSDSNYGFFRTSFYSYSPLELLFATSKPNTFLTSALRSLPICGSASVRIVPRDQKAVTVPSDNDAFPLFKPSSSS